MPSVRRTPSRGRSTTRSTSSAAASTFEQALSLLASGGTAVLIGLSPAGETATVDLPKLFRKRARVLVSHGGDHLPQEDFPRLARWALDGEARPCGDGHADGRARRLVRRVRRDARRHRDPDGADAVKPLDTFRGIVAGDVEAPPVARLIGMRMTEIEPGRAVFELDAGPQHASPLGTVARRHPLRPRRRCARLRARRPARRRRVVHDARAEDQLPQAGVAGPARGRGQRDQVRAGRSVSANAASPTPAARSSPSQPRRS